MQKKTINIIRCIVIALSLGLIGVIGQISLLLLLFLPLIELILREVKIIQDIDEREGMLHYEASHYTLIFLYIVVIIMFIHSLVKNGKIPSSEILIIFASSFIIRTIYCLGKGKGSQRLGAVLGFTFGGIWVTFAILAGGISIMTLMQSTIGGLILFATFIALKWPRIGGGILIIIGIIFCFMFRFKNGIFMYMLVPLPPIVAGISFYLSGKKEPKDEFSDFRKALSH